MHRVLEHMVYMVFGIYRVISQLDTDNKIYIQSNHDDFKSEALMEAYK